MAKGFKVKPKAPVQKEPEWDYELAKALIKGKTVSYTHLRAHETGW